MGVPPWLRTMPAARLLAPCPRRGLLQEHHAFQAAAPQEHGTPCADRPSADDHRVGRRVTRCRDGFPPHRRWHKLNLQSRLRRLLSCTTSRPRTWKSSSGRDRSSTSSSPLKRRPKRTRASCPATVEARFRARALELGLHATNMPREYGGGGYSMLQQVLVQEQGGRATNALGWVLGTPPPGFRPVATPEQIEQYVIPGIRRREGGVLRHHRGGCGFRRRRHRRHRPSGRRRLRARRRQVARHVLQPRPLRLLPGQADRRRPRRRARHVHRGPARATGVRVVRTPEYSHTIGHHHPIVAFEAVRVPATQLVGARG